MPQMIKRPVPDAKLPAPACPDAQRRDFNTAVAILGGVTTTARLLGCNERSLRDLMKGDTTLRHHWLEKISAQLRNHARICNHMERRLNPLYMANRTPAQRATTRPRHNREGISQ